MSEAEQIIRGFITVLCNPHSTDQQLIELLVTADKWLDEQTRTRAQIVVTLRVINGGKS